MFNLIVFSKSHIIEMCLSKECAHVHALTFTKYDTF